MALIKWDQELQLGIESVDSQHQKLVEILNSLDEAKRTGKGSRVMGEILQNLIDYTVEHFAHEEQLMEESGYPKTELHQAQHQQLVDKVLNFQHQFNNSGKRITKDVMQFLKYWLANHILQDDKTFGAHYVSSGAGQVVEVQS